MLCAISTAAGGVALRLQDEASQLNLTDAAYSAKPGFLTEFPRAVPRFLVPGKSRACQAKKLSADSESAAFSAGGLSRLWRFRVAC